jgi:hypothetical protein
MNGNAPGVPNLGDWVVTPEGKVGTVTSFLLWPRGHVDNSRGFTSYICTPPHILAVVNEAGGNLPYRVGSLRRITLLEVFEPLVDKEASPRVKCKRNAHHSHDRRRGTALRQHRNQRARSHRRCS